MKIPVRWGVAGPEIGTVKSYDKETGKIVAEIDDKEKAELIHRLLTEESPVSMSFTCESVKPTIEKKLDNNKEGVCQN